MPRISFTLPAGGQIHLTLEADHATIGRTADNDLVVPDPTVSSRHGEFTRHGDTYYYRDMASTNGSRINGQQAAYTVLQPGDHIALGTCEGIYAPESTTGMNADDPSANTGLAALCKLIARGDPTSVSIFAAAQEANARAQAKLCASWAASAGCGLSVILLRAVVPNEHAQFLLVEIGSLDAQWSLTNALATDDFARLEAAVLTADESSALASVTCHENFPQPDQSHTPDDGFLKIAAHIAQGDYVMVEYA